MKRRREKIKRELAELRKVRTFKNRKLRGGKNANTRSNKKRQKKRAPIISEEAVEINGLDGGKGTEESRTDIEIEKAAP